MESDDARPEVDELFAMLLAVQLSAGALALMRKWLAGIAHPAECIGLIEETAAGRSALRLRKKECWLPYLQCVCLTTPAHLLRAAA